MNVGALRLGSILGLWASAHISTLQPNEAKEKQKK
jgi:hypothetical protein